MPTAFTTVMDVAESEDNEFAEIIICNDMTNGILSSTSYDDSEIKIDDTVYKITSVASEKFSKSIKLNKPVTVWFDSLGRIAYMEVSKDSGMQTGYLMKAHCYDEAFGMTYVFKLFSNGTATKYELAEKVELDGKRYKMSDHKEFFLNFPLVTELTETSISIKPQVIRYELNKDGKIAKIDTTILGSTEDENKTLKLIFDNKYDLSKRLIYLGWLKRFGQQYMYDPTYTDVFMLPQGVEDGKINISGNIVTVDDSMYSSEGNFMDLAQYDLQIYDYDSENPLSEVIVSEQKTTVNEQNIYMFDNCKQVLNEDDEVVTALECFGAAGEKTIIIDDCLKGIANTLKTGDIIVVDTDMQGKKAYNIEKYFSGEELQFADGENRNTNNPYWYRGNYTQYGDAFIISARMYIRNITKGYAYNLNQDILEIMYEYDGNVSERLNVSNLPIIIFDKDAGRRFAIYQGTVNDIDTYKTSGDAAVVVVGYYSENAHCVFVYK